MFAGVGHDRGFKLLLAYADFAAMLLFLNQNCVVAPECNHVREIHKAAGHCPVLAEAMHLKPCTL